MGNSTVQEIYNTHIAATLRKLLNCAPNTGKKISYKVLAQYLGVKQQSVSSWCNGTTMPDTKHIKPIAEYFGVSCDFILGRTRTAAPDDLIQGVNERYGLIEAALESLYIAPVSNEAIGFHAAADACNRAKATAYRNITNLLLSNEKGKKALALLALYYYGQLDSQTKENGITFGVATRTDERQSYLNLEHFDENDVCEALLKRADVFLQELRKDLRGGGD